MLVRVQAAGVNPFETYVRAGWYTELPALPYTPGCDGAGVRVDTGERVYVTDSLSGTYAEYALCPEEDVRPLPDDLSYAQGAAIGVPYFTAYRALVQRAAPTAGERVLIHGASGGVGIATVQLAVAAGLDVVGTAGSEAGSDLVAAQGDVRVLDHRDPAHVDAALELTGGTGFDIIIEFLANVNLGSDLKLLAQRGRVVVVGSRGSVEVDARDLMNAEGAVLGMRTPNARPEEAGGRARRRGRRPAERRAQARGGPRAAARGRPAGPRADHGAAGAGQAGARPLSARRGRACRPALSCGEATRSMLASQALRPPPSRFVAISAASIPSTRNGGRSNASRSSACVTRRGPPSPSSCSLKQRMNTRAPRAVAAASEATYSPPLVVVEGVEEPGVDDGAEPPPELAEGEGVVHEELGLRGRAPRALARAAATAASTASTPTTSKPRAAKNSAFSPVPQPGVQHRPGHQPGVGDALERRLRPADVPGRGALVRLLEPARAHRAHLPGHRRRRSLFHRANPAAARAVDRVC